MPNHCDIVIVMESVGGRIASGAEAPLGMADRIREQTPCTVRVLILGWEVNDAAREIACGSGYDVTVISDPVLADYTHEAYRRILGPWIQAALPSYVLAADNAFGAEWVPSVAVDIGAGCITGVDRVDCADGSISLYKDLLGGKVKGRYGPKDGITLVTVQPGSFRPKGNDGGLPGTVTVIESNEPPATTQFLGYLEPMTQTADFSDARVIVAAGMGIGGQENLVWIRRLAALFPKAAVGGTRLVCDQNWLGYERQIGVTGATVSPALYIACGISGAAQHRVGMRGAGFVVAINTDPHAPIFSEADVCIVEELVPFIQLVVDACRTDEAEENDPE